MSRAGVYCAANACIEQVVQHGEVDVFQAVRTVRRHRPQLVNTMVSAGRQDRHTAAAGQHHAWWVQVVRTVIRPQLVNTLVSAGRQDRHTATASQHLGECRPSGPSHGHSWSTPWWVQAVRTVTGTQLVNTLVSADRQDRHRDTARQHLGEL